MGNKEDIFARLGAILQIQWLILTILVHNSGLTPEQRTAIQEATAQLKASGDKLVAATQANDPNKVPSK